MSDNHIDLTGDLTYSTVQQQRNKILQFLNHNSSSKTAAVVNLSKIQHSDSAGVALLIDIIKIAAHKQKTIVFQHLTQQMSAMIKFCNLESVIADHIAPL